MSTFASFPKEPSVLTIWVGTSDLPEPIPLFKSHNCPGGSAVSSERSYSFSKFVFFFFFGGM